MIHVQRHELETQENWLKLLTDLAENLFSVTVACSKASLLSCMGKANASGLSSYKSGEKHLLFIPLSM